MRQSDKKVKFALGLVLLAAGCSPKNYPEIKEGMLVEIEFNENVHVEHNGEMQPAPPVTGVVAKRISKEIFILQQMDGTYGLYSLKNSRDSGIKSIREIEKPWFKQMEGKSDLGLGRGKK